MTIKPMNINFEHFLTDKFLEIFPLTLDDDIPDGFDIWVVDLQVDDLIAYANEWAKTLLEVSK